MKARVTLTTSFVEEITVLGVVLVQSAAPAADHENASPALLPVNVTGVATLTVIDAGLIVICEFGVAVRMFSHPVIPGTVAVLSSSYHQYTVSDASPALDGMVVRTLGLKTMPTVVPLRIGDPSTTIWMILVATYETRDEVSMFDKSTEERPEAAVDDREVSKIALSDSSRIDPPARRSTGAVIETCISVGVCVAVALPDQVTVGTAMTSKALVPAVLTLPVDVTVSSTTVPAASELVLCSAVEGIVTMTSLAAVAWPPAAMVTV